MALVTYDVTGVAGSVPSAEGEGEERGGGSAGEGGHGGVHVKVL